MIQDLHSHTYYSFDSKDTAEAVVKAAITGGVDILGISDHNNGIAMHRSTTNYPDEERRVKDYQRSVNTYLDHMRLIADRYKSQIRILCGIEIATIDSSNRSLPEIVDISGFDYCLIEGIDAENTTVSDLFAFASRCGTKHVGIAHTDLFAYLERTQQDPSSYFSRMHEENIFWEMNVNFDSIHHYRTHQYVLDFFESPYQQDIVRKSGLKLSVGFDGHRIEDYRPDIVNMYCRKISELDLPLVYCEDTAL